MVSFLKTTTLFFAFIFISLASYASQIEAIKYEPIHEAFITRETSQIFVCATPLAPPPALNEKAPTISEKNALWIPGYWAWSTNKGEFLWVSGVVRRPPPGMQWIPGRWKQLAEGWVWLSGFWSITSEDGLRFNSQAPPSPKDEDPSVPPSKNYFWMAGHWLWDAASQQYVWLNGRWEKWSEQWVYVPPHYQWRGNGYLFVAAYWDWPLEVRGSAYPSIHVPEQMRSTYEYTPEIVIDPTFLLEIYYPYWPDYSNLFHFHYFFHHDKWLSWGVAPPWWEWNSWWALMNKDQWGLWWWWSHPGFPHPMWVDTELASEIPAPNQEVINLMKKVKAPLIITGAGVVSEQDLLKAIQKVTGAPDGPVFPTDPREILEIQEVAKPPIGPPWPYLRPLGNPNRAIPYPKPRTVSLLEPPSFPLETMRPPAKPPILYVAKVLENIATPIAAEGELPAQHDKEVVIEEAPLLIQPPVQESYPQESPSQPGKPLFNFQVRPPANLHPRINPLKRSRINPYQGKNFLQEKPYDSIEMQNRGDFMNHPMPQQNPSDDLQLTPEELMNQERHFD